MNHLETSNIYFPPITFDQVTDTWNIVRKTCKNRKAVFRYHIQKNTNNYQLYQILLHKSYQPYPFRLFLIFEPKPRLVMSQIVSDKVVNHFVARYYLLPYLEKKLIDSNVATRKGKGSKYAEKLLQDYINELRMHYPDQEILKKHDLVQYYRSYGSYYGYLNKVTVKAERKSNREFRLERKFGMRAVEKYEYFKKKYPKSIIFIKEGSFYKTYREDAIILWHLFQYKWNHDTVAFGIAASAKVFEYLQNQQIAYVTIDANSEEVTIPGDSEVYDLYVRLSSIHYEKYVKKEELHKLLDRLMDQVVHSYAKIKNLFETLLERGSQNEYLAKDS